MKRSRCLLSLGFVSLVLTATLPSVGPARGAEDADAGVAAGADGGTGAAGGTEGGGDAGGARAPGAATAAAPGAAEAAATAVRREGNVYILPSGLRYVELHAGKGAIPAPGKRITVHYTGWFRSGKQFDSSRGHRPYSFVWGQGKVIRGYEEGMATMRVGGRRKLIIPPDLAYGARGYKKIIPPNATLVFDVELLGVR